MLPYGLDQNVEFKKNFGPILGQLDLNKISKMNEVDFVERVKQVYQAIKNVSNNDILKNKNTIGFAGAPWTILVLSLIHI